MHIFSPENYHLNKITLFSHDKSLKLKVYGVVSSSDRSKQFSGYLKGK